MKYISKEAFDRIPDDYKGIFTNFQGGHPEWVGRRTAFLPGEGAALSVEGVHFLVIGDYDHLPVLSKKNAVKGNYYLFGGLPIQVHNVYRIPEEYAKKNHLVYLDRVNTDVGDFALEGGDIRSDLRKRG